MTLSVAEKQLQEDNRQVERLHDAITIAKQSPYYLNASGSKRLYFAFVPYDNQANVTVGAPSTTAISTWLCAARWGL